MGTTDSGEFVAKLKPIIDMPHIDENYLANNINPIIGDPNVNYYLEEKGMELAAQLIYESGDGAYFVSYSLYFMGIYVGMEFHEYFKENKTFNTAEFMKGLKSVDDGDLEEIEKRIHGLKNDPVLTKYVLEQFEGFSELPEADRLTATQALGFLVGYKSAEYNFKP